MAYNAVQQGAAGVDMGRNIFQSEAPQAMIAAVAAVVHKNMKPKEAFELFNSLKRRAAASAKWYERQILNRGHRSRLTRIVRAAKTEHQPSRPNQQ